MNDLEKPESSRRDLVDRAMKPDFLPFRQDTRYLEQEPECIGGALEVARNSEFSIYNPRETPTDAIHSFTNTFLRNLRRRTIRVNHDLRGQRDEGQSGLDRWSQ